MAKFEVVKISKIDANEGKGRLIALAFEVRKSFFSIKKETKYVYVSFNVKPLAFEYRNAETGELIDMKIAIEIHDRIGNELLNG